MFSIIALQTCQTHSFTRGVTKILFFGLAHLVCGFGVFAPLCFTLIGTPLSSFSFTSHRSSRPSPTAYAQSIIPGISISYILPIMIMALPCPTIISPETKQQAILFWHRWPFYLPVIMSIHHAICGRFRNIQLGPKIAARRGTQLVYRFGFLCSYLCHITSVAIVIASYIPGAIPRASLSFGEEVGDKLIMVIERGMTDILKWDYAMAAASAMVWALDARIKRFRAKGKQLSRDDYLQMCWDVFVGSVMDGPCSVALRISLGMDE
ncbi:atmA protein [Aspergillus tubingensis]|uniref:Uncharacterized protein n=1 Tax=Aspergillus niger TaxID=5061 RepID=A0A117DVX2_ASPNG|nr:atmA protein [Aspergillus tubingensis]GAQ35588.1 hypothetical protein ABL_01221 [Aspergillus niger]GFN14013.1 atmA protein [Aspergillus tubingensis]